MLTLSSMENLIVQCNLKVINHFAKIQVRSEHLENVLQLECRTFLHFWRGWPELTVLPKSEGQSDYGRPLTLSSASF